ERERERAADSGGAMPRALRQIERIARLEHGSAEARLVRPCDRPGPGQRHGRHTHGERDGRERLLDPRRLGIPPLLRALHLKDPDGMIVEVQSESMAAWR